MLIEREISMRKKYDACMSEQYFSRIVGSKQFLDLNETDFINLLQMGVSNDMRLRLKRSLKYCFGSSMVRSSKLGLRHVDKGVYVDQLYRWFVNFDRQNIIVETVDSWTDKTNFTTSFILSFQRILSFMNIKDDDTKLLLHQPQRSLLNPNKIWRDIRAVLDDFSRFESKYHSSITVNNIAEKKIIQQYLRIEKKLYDFYRPYNRLLTVFLHAVAYENLQESNALNNALSAIKLWQSRFNYQS